MKKWGMYYPCRYDVCGTRKNMVVKQDIIFMKKDYGLLLIAVEKDRIAGRNGCTLDGPDMYLDNVITEV